MFIHTPDSHADKPTNQPTECEQRQSRCAHADVKSAMFHDPNSVLKLHSVTSIKLAALALLPKNKETNESNLTMDAVKIYFFVV